MSVTELSLSEDGYDGNDEETSMLSADIRGIRYTAPKYVSRYTQFDSW